MVINDFDAHFRPSEQILKHEMVFISHDVLTPITPYPYQVYGGNDPTPYGLLILTNERILFLFNDTPYTGDLQKDKAKAIAKGAAKGVAAGIAHVFTFGASDAVGKAVSWQKGKLKPQDVDFTKYTHANSSVIIPLEKLKGYKMNYKNPMSSFSLKYPFNESYLSLNYLDSQGTDHWICMYSNIIGSPKVINPNKWLNAIRKVKSIPQSSVQSFTKPPEAPKTQLSPPIDFKAAISGLMTCPSCGKEQHLAKFCVDCGTKMPEEISMAIPNSQSEMITCSNCGKIQSPAKFCGDCGKELSPEPIADVKEVVISHNEYVMCWNCGTSQSPGGFCGYCGNSLADAPITIVERTAPEPTPVTSSPESTKEPSPEKIPEVQPRHTTGRFERYFKALFDERVREDILNTNYNFEAVVSWVIFIILWDIVLSQRVAYDLEEDFGSIAGPLLLPIALVVVVQLLIIFIITYIIGKMMNADITLGKIFRIYTYTFVIPLIISFVFISTTHFFLIPVFYVLNGGPVNLIVTLIDVLIMAIGFQTLFKTSYFKAFLLFAIVIVLSSIPVIIFGPSIFGY